MLGENPILLNQKRRVYTKREKRAFYYLYYLYNSIPVKNEEDIKKLEEIVKLINEARTLATWNTTDIIWYGILQFAEKYNKKEMLKEIAHDKYAPERIRSIARKLLEKEESVKTGNGDKNFK